MIAPINFPNKETIHVAEDKILSVKILELAWSIS